MAGYNIVKSFNGSVNTMCGEISDSHQLYMGTQLFIHQNLIQYRTIALFM